jgi:ADP-ribose pyrophosphatase
MTRNSDAAPLPVVAWSGKHLEMLVRGTWEYAHRKGICGIVGIVAVTPDGKLVLVEQYRQPVAANVIELPAGLAGDDGGEEDLAVAARRELLEETGYEAGQLARLFEGLSSAGLSDETITFFHATKLKKVGPGGGDAHENIRVHEVPLSQLPGWLMQQEARGAKVDLKVYLAMAVGAAELLERLLAPPL